MDKVTAPWHWHDPENIDAVGFNEWVYFYFSSKNIQGIIIYGWAWRHPGVMSVQFFPVDDFGKPETPVVLDDYHVTRENAERSCENYDVRLADCRLKENVDFFQIDGQLKDSIQTVSWHLSFTRSIPPIQSFEEPFGSLWFERIGWKILSARSPVEGTVTINGTVYSIDGGIGYTDSNYGRWLVAFDPATDWNWLTALDRKTSHAIVGMNIRSAPHKGKLHFLSPTKSISFPVNSDTFRHHQFAEDNRTGLMKPVTTTVHASNESGCQLQLTADNYHDFIFDQKFPLREAGIPLPISVRWPLIENFVGVNGEVRLPNGETIPVDAIGMKEYGVTSPVPYGVRKCFNRKWLALGK